MQSAQPSPRQRKTQAKSKASEPAKTSEATAELPVAVAAPLAEATATVAVPAEVRAEPEVRRPVAARADVPVAPVANQVGAERPGLGPMPRNTEAVARALEVWRKHFTWRSLPMTAAILPTWLGFANLVRVAQAVDEKLYPEYRDQPIDRPVFMFANARSGTTMLHRLMALDEERFATIKLYQTIFPTVSIEKLFGKAREVDSKYLGGTLQAIPDFLSRTFFGGWKDVHPMGLDKPEEDECLFVYPLHTPTLTLLLPFSEELGEDFFLDRKPRAVRDAVMGYYESCLKRFMYANGPTKRLLNKNVFTGPRLMTLHERFPDAVFLYLVRHPYESLGSYMDMWYRAWITHRPEIPKNSPEMKQFVEMALSHYRYALSCRKLIPKEQMLVVRYEHLTADPGATVERIYDYLGMDISPEFRAKLEAATEAQKSYKSAHAYKLEDFGITREWLREQLADVYEEFGYET